MRTRILGASLLVGMMHVTSHSGWAAQEADVVYLNADVATMDPARPTAQAIAIKDDTILAVGSNVRIERFIGPRTRSVNLRGATVLPGFLDPHSHFLGYAFFTDSKHWIDVSSVNLFFKPLPDDPRCVNKSDPQKCFIPVQNQDDVIQRITQAARKPGATGVYAMSYDPARLGASKNCTGTGLRSNVGFACPNFEDGHARATLDAISTRIPIFVSSQSGHISYANTMALRELNICGTDVAVPATCYKPATNPRQERRLAQRGQLHEDLALYADAHFVGKVLQSDPASALTSIQRGIEIYAGHGYTLVQEGAAAVSSANIYLNVMKGDPNFPLTVALMMYNSSSNFADTISDARQAELLIKDNDNIFIAGLKSFADGSPQGYTAFLSTPYYTVFPPFTWSIFPSPYSGLPDLTTIEMTRRALASHDAGYPLMIHQNGDRASRNAIRALESAKQAAPTDFRDIMLHDPLVDSTMLSDIKSLNNPISFLIGNIYFWGLPLCQQVLGSNLMTRRYAAYPAQSAAQLGLRVTLHSDSPVNPPDPLFMIWVAKTRKAQQPSWYPNLDPVRCPPVMSPHESLSIRQGIQAFTSNAAWQYNLSHKVGTITPGKLANLVLMSANPLLMEDSPDDLKTIRVLGTVHRGRFWENPRAHEKPIWPG